MTMKLKTVEVDGTTYAEVKDGHPVYLDGDKEVPFDAAKAKGKIKAQADDLAEAQSAQSDLAKWQKLGDLAEVRKAVGTLKALGDKGVDPEDAAIKLAEAQADADSLRETIEDRETRIKSLEKANFDLGVGSQIKGSNWIAENMLPGLAEDRDTVVDLYGKFIEPDGNGGHRFLDREGKPLRVDGAAATLDQFLDHHVPKALRAPSGANGSGDRGGLPTGSSGGAPKHKGDFKTRKEKIAWMDANPDEWRKLKPDPATQPGKNPALATTT